MEYLRNAGITDSPLLMMMHISMTSLTIGQIVSCHKSTEFRQLAQSRCGFYCRERDRNGPLTKCCHTNSQQVLASVVIGQQIYGLGLKRNSFLANFVGSQCKRRYTRQVLLYMSSKAPLDTTSATLRSINEETSNGIVRSREFRLRSSRAGGSSGTLHGAHVLLQQEVTSPEIVSRSNVTWSCRKLRLEEERGWEGKERCNRTDGRGVIEDYFVLVLNHLSSDTTLPMLLYREDTPDILSISRSTGRKPALETVRECSLEISVTVICRRKIEFVQVFDYQGVRIAKV
ncbi:hypothetical protein EAG_02380 [Camponotus floridanus]|uniref:Uncharacterized protein n=1 Tax=Camponotus floridanus TaxID=104421 RepID=E2ASM1_CAMFO|nr:hypothetical protein EAG_02380 [Camponotus floridanus]